MKQKGISIILVLIILAIAGAAGFFAYQKYFAPKGTILGPYISPSSTPDMTIDWQIIMNSGYGYSIKYPSSYKAIATGMAPDLTNANEVVISKDPNKEGLPVMYIEAYDKSSTVFKDLTLQQIVQEDFKANEDNKNVLIKMIMGIQSTTFAGVPAYTFRMESKGFSGKWQGFLSYTGVNNVLEFENGGFHYTIVYSENPDFSEILSTFKFIASSSPSAGLSCNYNGVNYKNGESVPSKDCNSCSCDNGRIACTTIACPQTTQ